MRLQRFLAKSGAASRRESEALIRQGRVRVNGDAALLGASVDPESDAVELDGARIRIMPRRWVLLHKPKGALCTRKDTHGRTTIYDLMEPWALGLGYAGRLDLDTTGLVILTNAGGAAARLAHPSRGVEREYVARVRGRVTARVLRALDRGVQLEDGLARAKRVRKVNATEKESTLRLILSEGRKRQARRMLKAVGRPILDLSRIRFGPFQLGGLPEGAWRDATRKETEVAERIARAVSRRRPRRR